MASSPQVAPHNSRSTEPESWAWFRLPLLVRRVFPSFALTLTDGIYLAALGRVGAALPLVAFCIGFFLSGFMLLPGQIFSASLFVVGALIAVSGLGAALGVWLLGGYICGDLLILRFARVTDVSQRFGQQGWRDVACVLVLYCIMALLLLAVPVISARLRQITLLLPQQLWLLYAENRPATDTRESGAGRSFGATLTEFGTKHYRILMFPVEAALQAVFYALAVYFWGQIAAVMMRSAFIWYQYPDVVSTRVERGFVEPLQYLYAPLITTACLVAVARVGFEYFATGKPAFMERVDGLADALLERSGGGAAVFVWLGELLRATLLVALLFGVLMTPFYLATTAVVLLISILLRKAILPRVTAWANWMEAIPLIARILVAGFLSYQLSLLMIADNLNASDFYPVLRPLWASMLLCSLLFPEPARESQLNPRNAEEPIS